MHRMQKALFEQLQHRFLFDFSSFLSFLSFFFSFLVKDFSGIESMPYGTIVAKGGCYPPFNVALPIGCICIVGY